VPGPDLIWVFLFQAQSMGVFFDAILGEIGSEIHPRFLVSKRKNAAQKKKEITNIPGVFFFFALVESQKKKKRRRIPVDVLTTKRLVCSAVLWCDLAFLPSLFLLSEYPYFFVFWARAVSMSATHHSVACFMFGGLAFNASFFLVVNARFLILYFFNLAGTSFQTIAIQKLLESVFCW
jgi:hypothetical protein